ncbi:MAG: 16S rRNA (cytosine(967)-C(5))-methyltransferase RsmB [Desulfosalsimonas sp.]|uniref:16S rRNA (cytosine(967)-C(5))-methyltransferase RsmB n=1 Tax=Desulfosalsimonas sp. TaxID=3073848 RepID=UPI00397100E3
MISGDARELAFRILNELETRRTTLDRLIDEEFEKIAPGMDRRDRALAFALVYGVLRWRAKLDWQIAGLANRPSNKIRPDMRNILRIGLFQMLFMSRIPESAAVNTAVNLAKKYGSPKLAGFVNALLRNAARQKTGFSDPDPARDPVAALAVSQSFPEWIVHRWNNRLGMDETRLLCGYSNQIPPLTLRANTLQISREALTEKLVCADAAETICETKYAPDGICLWGPHVPVSELPGFAEGYFQVQDEAAQLAAHVLDCRPGQDVLDACAGLGGKTGHIAQLMENRGRILGMDSDMGKLRELSLEMKRLGADNVETCRHDLRQPLDPEKLGTFDRILVDAPCSGLGVIRRNPDIKWTARQADFQGHARKQLQLLSHAAALLKLSGGVMIYAVCSMEPEETHGVVSAFLEKTAGFELQDMGLLFPGLADLADDRGCLTLLPHRHETDGFFIARLRVCP